MKEYKKKHSFYATDREYKTLKEYAVQNGRSLSAFILFTAKREASKHPTRPSKSEIEDIIQEVLQRLAPARAFTAEGNPAALTDLENKEGNDGKTH